MKQPTLVCMFLILLTVAGCGDTSRVATKPPAPIGNSLSPQPTAVPTPTPIPLLQATHRRYSESDFQSGVNLLIYGNDSEYQTKTEQIMDRLVGLNVNSLAIVFPFYQIDLNSSDVAKGVDTPSDELLKTVIREASARGIGVMLRPILDEASLTYLPNGWRGSISPNSPNNWFASYTNLMVGYAQLAEKAGVDSIDLGTELNSLEGYSANWQALAEAIKRVFFGQLTYSSNWNKPLNPAIVQKLNFVGVDAFYPNNSPFTASVEQMVSGWGSGVQSIKQRAQQAGLPVVATEIGVVSETGAQQRPWIWPNKNGPTDLGVQDRYYAATCQALKGNLAGMYWWEIDLSIPTNAVSDNGFNPLGKPAEGKISSCYA